MREEKGFTLIEVMVSIAIVSILTAIAVPSYRYLINSGRVSSDMNALVGTLQMARAEAIKRGQAVNVCASTNSTTATPTCSGSTNWATGWFAYADEDNSSSFTTNDDRIAVQGTLASGNTLVADSSISTIRFNREGFVSGQTATVTITLTPPSNAATQKRCLAVGSIGRLTVQKPGEGSC